MISPVLQLVLFVSTTFTKMPYPWHASCKIVWESPLSCREFKQRIISQLAEWEVGPIICLTYPGILTAGPGNCGNISTSCPVLPCGQRCLYEFVSSSESEKNGSGIEARHTTPEARYVDSISLRLATNNTGCVVHAHSNSQTWYAVLDYATNYCNLRNLVDGSGISDDRDFIETTSDTECTQYSMRDCSRY